MKMMRAGVVAVVLMMNLLGMTTARATSSSSPSNNNATEGRWVGPSEFSLLPRYLGITIYLSSTSSLPPSTTEGFPIQYGDMVV